MALNLKQLVLRSSFFLLLGLTVYFLYPKTFESQAQVMTSDSDANSLGLSSISSFLPMNVISEVKGPRIFSSIIKSKFFFSELITQDIRANSQIFTIKDYFLDLGNVENDNNEIQNHAMYLFYSNEVISVRHDKLTDIVTIKIFTNDPFISQQILSSVLKLLNKKLSEFSLNAKSSKKEFILERISLLEDELKLAESNYINFLSKNLDLERSPSLLIERKRLERVVNTKEALLIQLASELEINKIEEKRTNDVKLDIIEKPTLNPNKVSPKLSTVLLLSLFISLSFHFIIYFKKTYS
tara:strand:+ start:429 stop:1319 length:891 start_codon:yes stop_codon:yes gene_type:complete